MQHSGTFEREIRKRVGLQYLLFLPQEYGREADRRWPLILFLHGIGERGSDLETVKRHGLPKLLEERPDFPFVVVSPQCPAEGLWDVEALDALLDELLGSLAVDPDRVYLTGLSMGGYGTFALGLASWQRFAAIAPVCGGGMPLLVRPEHRSISAWVFHGAKDPVVPPSESERMVAALRGVGAEVEFTLYPDAGHDAWTETYSNPELYRWFLRHRRSHADGAVRRTQD